MHLRRMSLLSLGVLSGVMLSGVTAQTPAGGLSRAANKTALLIGIDTYQPKGVPIRRPTAADAKGRFAAGLTFENLKGPIHDVAAMRTLLTGEEFGFADDNEHIHVLLDSAATRDAILASLQKYLVDEPKPGDVVVLYISSHGSLRVNSKSDGQVFDLGDTGSGPTPLDNTIVPADAYLGAEDILNRDLRRIFNLAADKGVHLTVILDACHSGGQARGANDPAHVPRNIAYDPRDLAQPTDRNPDGSKVVAPEDRANNPVLVLSAAQKDQSAIDVQDANPPHGLFTQALIQALRELPPDTPAVDIFRRVIADMEINGANNQQPALDSTAERKHQPLFGGDAPKGSPRAAVISVEGGDVLLDIGPASDISTGSEFTEMTAVNGVKAVLRIKSQEGFTRSHAELLPRSKAVVRPKDLVELTTWVPAPRPDVRFYPGVNNLPITKIKAAAAVLTTLSIALVNDPSSDPWTYVISWNGTSWTLQSHIDRSDPSKPSHLEPQNAPPIIPLGAALRAC